MINWLSVIGNSFWIVGLALMLAGFSYFYWVAGQLGRSLRQIMREPRFQMLIVGGLLLVGIGLTITAGDLWQAVPAGALIAVCLLALLAIHRDGRDQRP